MRSAGLLAVPFLVLGVYAAAQDIPPAEEQAKAALEKSPRHGEWIDVKVPAGGAPIRTWVVYPERKEKAGVVLVIHEIFGLSDWIRAVADQLAKEGFIAVAPDLLSGKGPGGGGTESAASRDDVVKLDPDPHAGGDERAPERGTRVGDQAAFGEREERDDRLLLGRLRELRLRGRAAAPERGRRVLRHGATGRDPRRDQGARPRELRRRRRARHGHRRSHRGRNEKGGQDVRAARPRRRRPRVSPPADRQGGREPEGHARRVAPDGRVSERRAEVRRRLSSLACRPPGNPSRRRKPRSRGAGP